jgi:hypothetical protein
VAIAGNDDYSGSWDLPFATWQRAVSAAAPGDTILLQPGRYKVEASRSYGARITRSGRKSAPITMRGDGGTAILDCSGMSYRTGVYCLDLRASWWRIADIAVTGARQIDETSWSLGILVKDGSNNVLDGVVSHGHAGVGIRIEGNANHNLLQNCDVHHNFDDKTRPTAGAHADGIGVGVPAGLNGNRIVGCRTWANSDDGVDLWMSEGRVSISGSWSFWNGFVPDSSMEAGDGVGFKLGRNTAGPRHSVTQNLAFGNRYTGFDSNGAAGAMNIYNNVAMNNGLANFVFSEKLSHALRNNIAYGPVPNWLSGSISASHNSWNLLPSGVVAEDFQSVSSAGVTQDREADGSLPSLPFLKLDPGNLRMIDRGVDVGLPYVGSAPDLGAYEYEPTS